MGTQIESITNWSRSNPRGKLNALMHHFTKENLRVCLKALKKNSAVGVDGISKSDYEESEEENLERLVKSLREMSYRPKPVRRVEILKEDGSKRPLGISCTEDKIIQDMTRKILESIYEPNFSESSYGFRPNRSCHDALRKVEHEIMEKRVNWMVDMDISKFFDSMPHRQILGLIKSRISDRKFIRLISRLLKVGVHTPSGVIYDELGSPQGSIVSPVIANIYLDRVLDKWLAERIKPRGYAEIIRYADDAIVVFQEKQDAEWFMSVLPKRLAMFGLKLNMQKTRLIRMGKRFAAGCKRRKERTNTFDFLGFTHYWGKSRSGKIRLKRKTARTRHRRALVCINEWLRRNRNRLKLSELWKIVCSKIRGHYNYFGLTDNFPSLRKFQIEVRRKIFKWLNRRSQIRSFTWKSYLRYENVFPLPKPEIRADIFITNVNGLYEEACAGNPQAGF